MNVNLDLVNQLNAKYGSVVTRKQIKEMFRANGSLSIARSDYQNLISDNFRISRGKYSYEKVLNPSVVATQSNDTELNAMAQVVEMKPLAKSVIDSVSHVERNIIPDVDPLYVPFGFSDDMVKVVATKKFFPVFVSGLSGNGKTFMVEQACAKVKRECIRVNISNETDEDDLLGGFRLINGETKWFDGPVVQAMKSGAILILDEIDRGSNALLCIQGVMEGKGVIIKKTGEYVEPTLGFNVVATANTKGKGDESGKYMAATILDDAFLERFPITVEQDYPAEKLEKKILMKKMSSLGIDDEGWVDNLVKWANVIRKTYQEGGVDEIISTRRLVQILDANIMFDKVGSIKYCINRFDNETKSSFFDLYTKIDSGVDVGETSDEESAVASTE
tara:strand:- start:400 stop:1569 length:1170 start_codon:yes stop_codon:yes gene_type:complete